jgi:hypothetical protein
MSLPKFDPWSVSKSPRPSAYRAYCAYSAPSLGTTGTMSTSVASTANECGVQEIVQRTPAPEGLVARSTSAVCSSPWMPRLVALGWSVQDLLGGSSSNASTGGLARLLVHNRLLAATERAAYLETRDGKRIKYLRNPKAG